MIRLVKKTAALESKLQSKKQQLNALGRFENPTLRNLGRLLDASLQSRLDYIEQASGIPVPVDATEGRVNRLVTSVHSCVVSHKANKRKKKTYAKFIQYKMRANAIDAESVSNNALQTFFRRKIREEIVSPRILATCQDSSMNS